MKGKWIIVKLQAKSLDQELTLFYPCHKNKKNKKKKAEIGHIDYSWAFGCVYRVWGPNDPCHNGPNISVGPNIFPVQKICWT